jgi:hypothetical protein
VGSWTCGITSWREVRRADRWHRSGPGNPRRWLHTENGSDPSTGRWPTLLRATPLAPPCGSYRTTRSLYSSYGATVNAAFERLFPHPSEVARTSALRRSKNKTWKPVAPVPVLVATPGPNHTVLAGRARACPSISPQRSPTVNHGHRPMTLTCATAGWPAAQRCFPSSWWRGHARRLPRRLRRLAREYRGRPGRTSPRSYRGAHGPGYEGTRGRAGAASIRVGRTTMVTSGHPTRRSAWPRAGRSIPRSSLTTTRSRRRPCPRRAPSNGPQG